MLTGNTFVTSRPAPADPAAAIREVIAEPLGLGSADLPAYGKAEPGCCRDCLRGPLHHGSTWCVYCWTLAQYQIAAQPAFTPRRYLPGSARPRIRAHPWTAASLALMAPYAAAWAAGLPWIAFAAVILSAILLVIGTAREQA